MGGSAARPGDKINQRSRDGAKADTGLTDGTSQFVERFPLGAATYSDQDADRHVDHAAGSLVAL
ncbi:hypothetical protein HLY00_3343 [Mycolicibacterium hippocampi]|uniref:Uncharacterized protein n=1 Tax=Mycolicibacterium hippocampi TaxID=659824 RepID=A0A850PNN9_9MYCO|nr:hypothetical protein [Mycolicibacterium hippocampi]